MDSQAEALAGSVGNQPCQPIVLQQAMHEFTSLELDNTKTSNNFREILISASDVCDLSTGMRVAEPAQLAVVAGFQEPHKITQKDGGLKSNSTGGGLEKSSAYIERQGKDETRGLPDSTTAVENQPNLHILPADRSASSPSNTSNHEAVRVYNNRTNKSSIEISNSVGSNDNTEASSYKAIERDLARSKDAIISDREILLQRQGERTPGDGEENPLDTCVVPPNQTNCDTISNTALSPSESELDVPPLTPTQPAVLDITSSEEIILGDFDVQDESPISPATIDIVNLGSQFIGSKLKRPKSLEGCFNLDANSPRWTSPDKSHSLRTTPSASNPHFLEEFTEAGKTATDKLQETLSELTQEGQFDSKNPRLSGILQHELRSRASFTSVSSLSTDYSSSLATDDLSETRDSLEPGFVEVNLHSQTSPGDHWAYATQGAKPKKRGLAGFLAR